MWRAKKARRAFSRAVAAAFVKKTDPNTGYEYYFHTATGESSWEVPKLVGKVANWGKKKKLLMLNRKEKYTSKLSLSTNAADNMKILS